MTTIDDVASHVVGHFGSGISTMKLQKLCYLAQGWSLALLNRPLFDSEFQAWKNGPVSPELFAHHRREFTVSAWPWGAAKNLDSRELIVVDAMLRNYEALSGVELSELTHRDGTPWSLTRASVGATSGTSSQAVIPKDVIREHYLSRLMPGTPASN